MLKILTLRNNFSYHIFIPISTCRVFARVCVLGAHRRALRAYGCVPTPKIRVKAIFIFRQKPSFFFIFSTYPYGNCPFFRHPDFPIVLSVEASRCSTGLQKIFFGGTK